MAYLGNTPTSQNFTSGTNYFNGDGSTVAFTLSRQVSSINDVIVVIENVVQKPLDAYGIVGTTLTFTSAPPSGTNNIYVRYISTITTAITPNDLSVTTEKIADNVVTVGKLHTAVLQPANISDKANTSTGYLDLPTGTTAQRPASPDIGATRFNTTLNLVEAYHANDGWIALSNTFQAAGGTISSLGSYTYHTFTSSGTFVVSSGLKTVDYLIIAGGGAGGSGQWSGGGGAGGYLSNSISVSTNSYSIVIGAGGAGISFSSSPGNANAGSNTTAFGLTAIGGGRGGGRIETSGQNGGSGGSGGGSASWSGQTYSGGAATSGQGNRGGNSVGGGQGHIGGGGGGAGAQGSDATDSATGVGGVGLNWQSLGTFYAGGGGAGAYYIAGGNGGNGGGGAGSSWTQGAGTPGAGGGGTATTGSAGVGGAGAANKGAGGGAGMDGGPGGTGGSGIVIIRYIT
jgi:hypothetical protein